MAFPTGSGYRTVQSMLMEMSLHLLEPILSTTLLDPVPTPGSATVRLGSFVSPSVTSSIYERAQLLIDTGLSQESITVTAFDPVALTITATFTVPHTAGIPVLGATFPTQAIAGDPFYTQSEILSYIARAQNQFLSDIPVIFSLNTQNVLVGQVLQPVVCNAVEMHRVASSSRNVALASLTRLGNVVTAVSQSPNSLSVTDSFAIFGAPDPTFDGAFKVATILSPTSWTYSHVGPDSSTVGGGNAGSWLRLYEVSQTELTNSDPQWRNNFVTSLTHWGEDRTGLYQFFVGKGKPSTNLPIEILCSIRDTDTLQLGDMFLVPDPMIHYPKYKALEYCWSKDGEQRNPQSAAYAKMRYERGVLASKRWLGWGAGLGGRA